MSSRCGELTVADPCATRKTTLPGADGVVFDVTKWSPMLPSGW